MSFTCLLVASLVLSFSLCLPQSENISKYEIMDGAPVRGESIPIRLFLSPYELTPTQRSVQNKFSVKYYLNLVLVDEEDRRYFKQQEVRVQRMQRLKSSDVVAAAEFAELKLPRVCRLCG